MRNQHQLLQKVCTKKKKRKNNKLKTMQQTKDNSYCEKCTPERWKKKGQEDHLNK
jgi:hypothetical protein